MMGVSFTTNAQEVIYEMPGYNISGVDSVIASEGAGQANEDIAIFQFFGNQVSVVDSPYVAIWKSADLTNVSSLDIELDYISSYNHESEFVLEFYIDDILMNTANSNSSMLVTTFTIPGNASFTDNSSIKIVIKYDAVTYYESAKIELEVLKITKYGNTSGIEDNGNTLSDNLEIYFYNKSVFLTADERMDADITVYNMSGRVVSNKNMEISNSKTELNLNHLENGMYIVMINDGVSSTSKKVYLN